MGALPRHASRADREDGAARRRTRGETRRPVGGFDVRTSDFDYDLPREMIAQYPSERRDESRLLVLRKDGGPFEHRRFRDVLEYLRPDDCLVINESRVIPARLVGRKAETGGKVEVLLLEPSADGLWRALVRPGARVADGTTVVFSEDFRAVVESTLEGGKREVRLLAEDDPLEAVDRVGKVPLPPYIDREAEAIDSERYQTVYARVPGAVAAPTAGLHFTEELLERAVSSGVRVARVILHVGLGTFRPVSSDDPEEHAMDEERYELPVEAADAINGARRAGGRIVAVGTTAVRVLESTADEGGVLRPGSGSTDLFIRPPYRFRAVDALVTNFHLPKSTLLMLVSALAGRERVLEAYREAVATGYRFYSYGDAMLII
ncbi:MAG: tRNA preQ1(34) S-adenosylmethionine ribosyltransferase-isomerase QueA [Candidatus Eisenbacteria bacterium]|nr:tRNA preQ1(34) S-adenosylmethionine ribosyltransferase-isomerase QueA [Candidatus Eisenbacteria bacterium]